MSKYFLKFLLIFRFHLDHIKKLLEKRKIQQLWINSKGEAMSKHFLLLILIILEPKTMTDLVRKVSNNFLSKKLTPSCYRRILPSLLFKEILEDPCESVIKWMENYADLVNTSVEMLESNYICTITDKQVEETSNQVQEKLQLESPIVEIRTERAKKRLEEIDNEFLYTSFMDLT